MESKDYREILCKNLVELRKKHKYTQEYVADYLGTKQQHYSKYEKGIVELPIWRLIMLCDLYNVSADKMLGRLRK